MSKGQRAGKHRHHPLRTPEDHAPAITARINAERDEAREERRKNKDTDNTTGMWRRKTDAPYIRPPVPTQRD